MLPLYYLHQVLFNLCNLVSVAGVKAKAKWGNEICIRVKNVGNNGSGWFDEGCKKVLKK